MLPPRVSSVVRRLRAQAYALRYRGFSAPLDAQVGRGCRIHLAPGATVTLGRRVQLDDGTTVACASGATITFADGSFTGHHCTVAARDRITIGPGTYLAELVSIRDHDHDPDQPPSSGAALVAPVTIGGDCWLAAKVTVLRGTTIGDRTVVAANAVVRGDVPSDVVVGGIPARELRRKPTNEPPPSA